MSEVTVATYNVHAGVDGWGRPFDVVEPCRQIDADVLVLQESWSPDVGRPLAHEVAAALGYTVTELTLGRGRVVAPPSHAGGRWGPRLWDRHAHGMRLNHSRASSTARRRAQRLTGRRAAVRGTWGIALLSRLPVIRTWTIDLGQLRSDPARRGAIVADLDAGGTHLTVVGTHFAHLTQGSPLHMRRLRQTLGDVGRSRSLLVSPPESRARGGSSLPAFTATAMTGASAVLAGDMNLWGPPLLAMFPGWVRAVRGRSWPSWSAWPVAQTDHILVTGRVRVVTGEVLRIGGSDHFPVRARLVIDEDEVGGIGVVGGSGDVRGTG
jgi:endonuclease/exonuclease/phosphatase family metal-dependent hydrolase